MDFEKNVPEWHAEGTEPPASLKQSGFEAGYKPPAAYFNWFWNRVSACLTEIRNKLKGHVESTSNPHGVTASQIGLDKVDNTSDAEKSVKRASTSGTADKTKSAMTVRLNGGNTEGADKWTFDGSTARSVNITPSGIGASKSDLSNVDNAVFRSKASSAGATGLPIVAAESTDGVAYTATVPSVTELSNGLTIVIVPNKTSTTTQATLNVNGLGAKGIRIPLSFNSAAMSLPKLDTFFTEGRPVTVQFDAGYASGGIWKTIDKQRTSAQDLYGLVPVESGGTGATDAATARTNIGAEAANTCLPLSGGTMTGDIDFGNAANNGIQWTTDNGTRIRIRPYSPNNIFQITMKPSDGDEFGAFGMDTSGSVSLSKPLSIANGGTGATDAATARNNLNAAAANHTHGMITSDGKLSGQANKVMVVDANGSITAYGGTAVRGMIGAEAANTCLPLAGGTITGDTTVQGAFWVSNSNSASGYVKMWEDNEGGNIAIGSPDGHEFQFDAHSNAYLRCYAYGDDNVIRGFSFKRANGDFCTDGNFYAGGKEVWHAGNLDIQVGVAANVGTTEKNITFPRAFAGIPVVTANGSAQTSIRVYNVTATGCTLVSGSSNNTVQWQAIYTG